MDSIVVAGVIIGVMAFVIGVKGLFEGKDPSTAAIFIGVSALCVGIALLAVPHVGGVLFIAVALLLFAIASRTVRGLVVEAVRSLFGNERGAH